MVRARTIREVAAYFREQDPKTRLTETAIRTLSSKKKYQYLKKAITLPNGTRKYIYGKTQQELDEKHLQRGPGKWPCG